MKSRKWWRRRNKAEWQAMQYTDNHYGSSILENFIPIVARQLEMLEAFPALMNSPKSWEELRKREAEFRKHMMELSISEMSTRHAEWLRGWSETRMRHVAEGER